MKLWEWLKDPTNRTALGFIGAGIAALVTLLVQSGLIPPKPAPPPASVPLPATTRDGPASATGQTAVAEKDGVATNIRGDHNQVRIDGKDK